MGPVKSKRRLPEPEPEATEAVQPMEDLKYLPDELLLEILSWVPDRSLVRQCRLVCRKWRDLIDKPTLWRLKCERDPLNKAAVEAAQGASQTDWRRIYLLRPFGRNLIKNPRGKNQLQHWKMDYSWIDENVRDAMGRVIVFYCFGSPRFVKSQVVDFLEEGLGEEMMDTFRPDIFIADWWSTQYNCGQISKIEVELLAADQASAIASFIVEPKPIRQPNDTKYQQVSHVFQKYGPGVRYLRFCHTGKDIDGWQGHSTAIVTFSLEPLYASTLSH